MFYVLNVNFFSEPQKDTWSIESSGSQWSSRFFFDQHLATGAFFPVVSSFAFKSFVWSQLLRIQLVEAKSLMNDVDYVISAENPQQVGLYFCYLIDIHKICTDVYHSCLFSVTFRQVCNKKDPGAAFCSSWQASNWVITPETGKN